MRTPIPGVPAITICTEQGELKAIHFLSVQAPHTRLAETAARRTLSLLQHYFSDARFPMPQFQPPHGTPFQQRVWQRLQQIPAGEVMSYGELAAELGSSAQAVAGACRANPLPILIPCHRVVASKGLGGYMGETEGEAVAIKRWLLHHEGYV